MRVLTLGCNDARWIVVLVTCLGVLMVTLDHFVVNVALASIRADLGFSETSLVWVVNGFQVPYGGFLLLCGRGGDRYGHRRLFSLGIILFTLASLGCGMAPTATVLILARAIQGVGAAAVSAVAFSLLMHQFDEPSERARALAIYSCVVLGGGSAGVVLAGFVTVALSWRWIFLLNLPIGLLVYGLCGVSRFQADREEGRTSLDVMGAVTITATSMLVIVGALNATKGGWDSVHTLPPLCGAAVTLVMFFFTESRASLPLIPLKLFKARNLRVSVIAGTLWSGAQVIWYFVAVLYLQLVLGYDPLEVGLAFLPATVLMALFALGLSGHLATRFGPKLPMAVGLAFIACGLALLARAPIHGHFTRDVLPGMVLIGLGCGSAYSPFLMGAVSDVSKSDYGLASGVLNSAVVMGGSLALALTVSVSTQQENRLIAAGVSSTVAESSAYHLAFGMGAAFALGAALIALLLRHSRTSVQDIL